MIVLLLFYTACTGRSEGFYSRKTCTKHSWQWPTQHTSQNRHQSKFYTYITWFTNNIKNLDDIEASFRLKIKNKKNYIIYLNTTKTAIIWDW